MWHFSLICTYQHIFHFHVNNYDVVFSFSKKMAERFLEIELEEIQKFKEDAEDKKDGNKSAKGCS